MTCLAGVESVYLQLLTSILHCREGGGRRVDLACEASSTASVSDIAAAMRALSALGAAASNELQVCLQCPLFMPDLNACKINI